MPNSNKTATRPLRWFAIAFTGLALLVTGCTTSELDENERALVAKQQLADKFDQLFNLAFESPDKAEEQFNQLVFSDLVTDDHNLLADDDVRAFQTLVQIAVRLNRDVRDVPSKMSQNTLFDMYIARNQLLISSGSTLYELPYRLRSGERYQRLKELVAQVDKETPIEEQNTSSTQRHHRHTMDLDVRHRQHSRKRCRPERGRVQVDERVRLRLYA